MKLTVKEILTALKTKQSKHDLFCRNCIDYHSLWCYGACPIIKALDNIDDETLLNMFANKSFNINKVKRQLRKIAIKNKFQNICDKL